MLLRYGNVPGPATVERDRSVTVTRATQASVMLEPAGAGMDGCVALGHLGAPPVSADPWHVHHPTGARWDMSGQPQSPPSWSYTGNCFEPLTAKLGRRRFHPAAFASELSVEVVTC